MRDFFSQLKKAETAMMMRKMKNVVPSDLANRAPNIGETCCIELSTKIVTIDDQIFKFRSCINLTERGSVSRSMPVF